MAPADGRLTVDATPDQPSPALARAIDLVARSCRVARLVQAELDRVRQITKDDRSPVTVADFAVQAVVALELQELGEARIVGEEHAGALRGDDHAPVRDAVTEAVRHERPDAGEGEILDAIDACDHDASDDVYWTLDPVDGTKGFLRGQQYAIALARIEAGAVTMGVLGCPNLPADPAAPLDVPDAAGTVYAAESGRGVWWCRADGGPGPRRLERPATTPGGLVRLCESVEAAHSRQEHTRRVIEMLGGAGEPARLDSQCKYAVVARGQADAYLRLPTSGTYVEKVWDHAAGMLVAIEAGVTVTDITGSPLDFTHGRRLEANRGIVGADPAFHGRIIEAIEHLGIGSPTG
jgi:3'(2'), 5'-bisphosphate nucleotidase